MSRQRPYIPLKTKLDITLRMLGFDPAEVEWHHPTDDPFDVVPVAYADHLAIHGRSAGTWRRRGGRPAKYREKPWTKAGMSRATWYRHEAETKLSLDTETKPM